MNSEDDLVSRVTEAVLERLVRNGQVTRDVAPPLGMRLKSDVPLGVELVAPVGTPEIFQIFPEEGYFIIEGVRSFNEPGDVEVVRLTAGPNDFPQNAGAFDSASYSLTHGAFSGERVERHLAFYRVPWGLISIDQPLNLTLRSKTMVPSPLRWTLYGYWGTSDQVDALSNRIKP